MTHLSLSSLLRPRVFPLLVVLLLAFLPGCPDTTPVSSAGCARVGDACPLANGTLGVCSESLAVACASPPCLACTSQH